MVILANHSRFPIFHHIQAWFFERGILPFSTSNFPWWGEMQIYLHEASTSKQSMSLLTLIFPRTQKHISTGYVRYSFCRFLLLCALCMLIHFTCRLDDLEGLGTLV